MTPQSDTENFKFTNRLIHETSPYLLQHAHNPVDWHAWNPNTLEKARSENKMLLISIGYSACHWCHVMEHETFENEKMAELMNANFICIKVDREERPDVDAVYMNAVQLIHGNGGWPLNCFALPDGKPFYGGTYFQPSQWKALLENIVDLYQSRRSDLEDQAQQILEGINQENIISEEQEVSDFHKNDLDQAYQNWKGKLDNKNGGSKGAPKFPMPSNLLFLLRYGFFQKNEEVLKYFRLSLDKMAKGGIYDQLSGGFARYSVDAEWKVPHFEKMLYDNAQLISLYTEGFQLTQNPEFLQVALETADFVLKELTSPEGFFYSALDADTEGEEGKFYVWTKEEFDKILLGNSDLIAEYFEIDGEALWEDDNNVLMRTHSPESFADKKGIDREHFFMKLNASKQKLLESRNLRTRPGLDDKSLTSWNALMIKALAHLSVISENNRYLDAALKAANLIKSKLFADNGHLHHNYKNGVDSIDGFLEDYAFVADAAIELFQLTADEKWIGFAKKLTEYAIQNFYDEEDGLFWFTDSKSHDLVSRKKEIYDNVIPSSNSTLAIVLVALSKIYELRAYEDIAKRMAGKVVSHVKKHPASFSNWANLIQMITGDFYEIVVVGNEFRESSKILYQHYYPAKVTIGSNSEINLPIFKNRFVEGKTMIYVCSNNVCKRPVELVEEAIAQLVN